MEAKLPSPFTGSSQPFSVKSFRWRNLHKRPKTRLVQKNPTLSVPPMIIPAIVRELQNEATSFAW